MTMMMVMCVVAVVIVDCAGDDSVAGIAFLC